MQDYPIRVHFQNGSSFDTIINADSREEAEVVARNEYYRKIFNLGTEGKVHEEKCIKVTFL